MYKPTTINRYLDDSSSEKFTLNKFSLRPKKRSRNAIRLFKPKQNAFIKREKRLKWRDAEKRAYIYIYIRWKTLGRRIGRLSKNTRHPFEKPPRHNLLSPFSPSFPNRVADTRLCAQSGSRPVVSMLTY